GLLAVTSADRLNAGWTAAQRARERGLVHARAHIEKLMADVPSHCGIVTVLDGHPATLAWLGAVRGHRVRALGVEHFGQTGSIPELYRHYGIDANAIVAAAAAPAPGRPVRHLKALPQEGGPPHRGGLLAPRRRGRTAGAVHAGDNGRKNMISTISRRGVLTTTGVAALSLLGHRSGFAQQFPARGILVIVPYAAGGGSDVSARLLARDLEPI